MARLHSRTRPATTLTLQTVARACSACGGPLRAEYRSHRTVVSLDGPLGLDVQVRRCQSAACRLFYVPIRAEAEGRLVLPSTNSRWRSPPSSAPCATPSTAASPVGGTSSSTCGSSGR